MLRKIMVAIALLACAQAQAEFLEDPKVRFGIGGGKFEIEYEDLVEFDSKGWEIFGGYEFNKYFALEAGYLDAGDDTISGPGGSATFESSAFSASAIGSFPIGDAFSLFARAGLLAWEVEISASNGASATDDGNDPFFGFGAGVLVEGALLRAEYRLAEIDDADLTAITLSVAWRF